jgi:hypothetical protein
MLQERQESSLVEEFSLVLKMKTMALQPTQTLFEHLSFYYFSSIKNCWIFHLFLPKVHFKSPRTWGSVIARVSLARIGYNAIGEQVNVSFNANFHLRVSAIKWF